MTAPSSSLARQRDDDAPRPRPTIPHPFSATTTQPRLTTVLVYRRHRAITGKCVFFYLLFLVL